MDVLMYLIDNLFYLIFILKIGLMKSKDYKMLPSIVDENNKILKQVRIEEIQEQLSLDDNIYKLSEYATELKLDAI